MVVAYFQGTRELREVSGASFEGIATETARRLDIVFKEEINRSELIASDPLVVQLLEERYHRFKDLKEGQVKTQLERAEKQWKARDPALIQAVSGGALANLLKEYFSQQHGALEPSAKEGVRASTRSLFLTDSRGELVASIGQEVSYLNAGENWWQGGYDKMRGKPYFENVYFDEKLGLYAFSLSIPVRDKIGFKTIGILHRVFDAQEYLDPYISPIRFGKTGHVMLIDSEGTVMRCPILPTGVRLPDPELIRLVTGPQEGWVNAPSDGHGSQVTSVIGYSPLSLTSSITQESTGKSWYTFVWQSSDELFAPTRKLFTWISMLGLIGIGFLGAMGYLAAARIVRPIKHLQDGAARIAHGELKEPIRVSTGDEIEQLADEFNKMNIQLQKAFSGLEHKVEEKTQEVLYLQKYNEQILESVPNPIIILDLEGHIDYLNKPASQVLNQKNGNLKGCNLFDLEEIGGAAGRKLQGELDHYVNARTDKNKIFSESPSSFKVTKDPLSPPPVSPREVLRKELNISSHTYQYEWFLINKPLGEKDRVGLVLRDITHESRIKDKLFQTERLASLEILSSGIGHELNNPLFSIFGLSEEILEGKEIPKIKENAKKILNQAKRMAETIRGFSGHTRVIGKNLRLEVEVNAQLDRALKLVGVTPKVKDLIVQKNYQTLPRIQAGPEDLVQVFVNIMKNAIQAMKGKGTLFISTNATPEKVIVKIRDSGPGIPKSYLPRIFDPFFTTKGPGQGTGLGLTVAHRIVTNYGGNIEVETKEGVGTTIIINFPISNLA